MKKMVLLLCLWYISTSAQNQKTTVFDDTDAYVNRIKDSLQIVGVNYAVLINNKLVHQQSFGLANAQLKVPMTLDNSFPVASISKLFSAVALYKQLSQHQIGVNETIAAVLPNRKDLPASWRKLTLKQLLSHTSGVPDQIDYQVYLAPESEAAVIAAIKDKPFSTAPGVASKYNATGFLLLRAVIEKLAGQDFESFMQSTYFDTFKLSSAQYGGFKKVISNRVTCYHNSHGNLEMLPLNYSAPMYAGAGLNIAMGDLIKWFQLLNKGEILTKAQLTAMWAPVILNNGKEGGFGLGWESYRLQEGYRMVGHGGAGISSFRHYWHQDSKQSVTVIVLTNGAFNWSIRPNQINAQIATMVLDAIASY